MSDIILLSDVRLSFPHLVEPQKQVNEQTGQTRVSYNCEFIMPQEHPGFQAFFKRYGELALDKWKEHANTVMKRRSTRRLSSPTTAMLATCSSRLAGTKLPRSSRPTANRSIPPTPWLTRC